MDQNLSGQVTQEQIDKWKEENKITKVFTYKVDSRIGYLKPVDRTLYSIAATKVSTSPAKFTETIIEGIWLGGDETIRKVDQYYFGLIDFVDELMNKKKGELGEL